MFGFLTMPFQRDYHDLWIYLLKLVSNKGTMEPQATECNTNNFPPHLNEETPAQADIRSSPRKREIKKKKRSTKKTNPSEPFHWVFIEQRRYVKFLVDHRKYYDLSLRDRKKKKIHVLMSKFIKVKNSIQCRTHHQKMVEKFKSVDGIINYFLPMLSTYQVYPSIKNKFIPVDEIKREPGLQECEYRTFKTSGELLGQRLVKVQERAQGLVKGREENRDGMNVKEEQKEEVPYLCYQLASEIPVKEQAE